MYFNFNSHILQNKMNCWLFITQAIATKLLRSDHYYSTGNYFLCTCINCIEMGNSSDGGISKDLPCGERS